MSIGWNGRGRQCFLFFHTFHFGDWKTYTEELWRYCAWAWTVTSSITKVLSVVWDFFGAGGKNLESALPYYIGTQIS